METMQMEKVSKLVPELRFNNDNGNDYPDWEEKRLGELAKYYDGTHQTPNYVESGIPFYSVEHITANQFVKTKFISEEVFEKENKRVKLEQGDILMTRIGDIGTARLIDWDVKASFYVSIALIKQNKNYNSSFLNQYISSVNFQKELWANTIHVAFPKKINLGEIGKCKIHLPNISEQQKIATFLSAVDEKIQQLTRKKELLEQYKKGVMQQLFSGKLRFKDENGDEYADWEEKILDDVILFINGKGHEQSIDENGEFVVVNSKFVSTNGRVRKFCNTQISPLSKGEMVMVMSDVPNGKALAKCYLIEKDSFYTLNQRICGLKAKTGNLNDFLIYLLNRNKYYLSFDSGVGQTNLKKDEVLGCPLFVPSSFSEQQKIANFLSSIDVKIESTTQQINQTQTFKKGLLQKMFV
jgi:type I restriction enzyme S subunit